jgi:hypothetical protein
MLAGSQHYVAQLIQADGFQIFPAEVHLEGASHSGEETNEAETIHPGNCVGLLPGRSGNSHGSVLIKYQP